MSAWNCLIYQSYLGTTLSSLCRSSWCSSKAIHGLVSSVLPWSPDCRLFGQCWRFLHLCHNRHPFMFQFESHSARYQDWFLPPCIEGNSPGYLSCFVIAWKPFTEAIAVQFISQFLDLGFAATYAPVWVCLCFLGWIYFFSSCCWRGRTHLHCLNSYCCPCYCQTENCLSFDHLFY